eukprot:Selendium_serpulae@DN8082_c0_g1_i1.p1
MASGRGRRSRTSNLARGEQEMSLNDDFLNHPFDPIKLRPRATEGWGSPYEEKVPYAVSRSSGRVVPLDEKASSQHTRLQSAKERAAYQRTEEWSIFALHGGFVRPTRDRVFSAGDVARKRWDSFELPPGSGRFITNAQSISQTNAH